MKNGEFIINTKAGVVVFAQKAHGKMYTSMSRVDDVDKFNVGVGQLIAMKRNEIKIRKHDLDDMRQMVAVLSEALADTEPETGGISRRLCADFCRQISEKINASQNHVRELRKDLNQLYKGEYDMPMGVKLGTHMYTVVDGSVKVVPCEN